MAVSKTCCCFSIFLVIFTMAQGQEKVNCLIKTEMGHIEIELYPNKAPVTVQNFLQYVDSAAYDNSSFFRTCTPENEADRTVKIEVVQGGNIDKEDERSPIPMETTTTTGILHKNGTISMARNGPNSATSSFFICINDQPELDYGGKRNPDGQGFAAFGKVTKGMEVVKKIQAQKDKNQYLIEPVKIRSIRSITK